MRNMKRTLALMLSLAMAGTIFAGCSKDEDSSSKAEGATTTKAPSTAVTEPVVVANDANSDKVLTVYAWNEEFKGMLENYYLKENPLPAGYTLDFVVNPSQDGVYQQSLDLALEDKTKIDIFLIEADYALKYVESDWTKDISSLGITSDDLANQYTYTQDIATDSNGVLKGTSWQATPGLFTYRRSIAKDVFGTDDPAEIQALVSDWDKFDAAAVEVAEGGKYTMLSGFDDAYRTFSNNMSAPWVNDDGVINVDESLLKWVDQTKTYTDKGYNQKTSLWDGNWTSGQTSTGNVFGYFYSTWGINFTLLGNSLDVKTDDGGVAEVGNGIFGDWACVAGPQSYFWGGTWLCASQYGDDAALVADIMKYFTTETASMEAYTLASQDYVNNKESIKNVIDSGYSSAFLGGQDHISLFAEAADKIDMSKCTGYDQLLNESFQKAMSDYFNGTVTKDKALENFYNKAIEVYPDLTRPS